MDSSYKIIQETILTDAEKDRLVQLKFHYLPDYAKFILENKLRDFAISQLQLARKLKIPLLKYFESLSDEILIENGMRSAEKLLESLSENSSGEYIIQSVNSWVSDQGPIITTDQVVPEDLILISYARRTTFRDFLIYYTKDLAVGMKVAEEMDRFTVELDSLCFKILVHLQQRLYKQAQSIASMGNWEWDLKKNKLKWSDEMFRIYEIDPHSESYNNVAALNHPEDAPFVLDQMKRSRETFTPHDFYYRICLKNGKEKFLHAKGEVITDENGEAVKMFGTLQDRTQQKAIEKKLQDEQYFIAQIAELTPSIIATYNINTGKYLFINKALQPLLGYDPQEVMVKGVGFFVDIIHPDDLETLMEKNRQALFAANQMSEPPGHEPISEFTYRMRHKNGEYRWFQTLGTIFSRNKINQVEEVLNISVDVTNQVEAAILLNIKNEELSKSEERYQQKNEALEQINQELESFNYVASHDLKEPLRKIKLFTDRILQKNEQLPEDIKEYFTKIVSASLRMEQLINSVLRYSRTSAEERKLVDMDLNVLLAEVKLDLIEDIKDKKAEIEANILPTLPVDAFQFHQLFTNLISNGIKYSQQGIPPIIKISSGMSSMNETDTKGSNGLYHTITFADNGIGFKQVYAEKIFGLFQRLHPRHEFEGTGIGLAICKKIMQNHDGFIRAKGEPGKGAEFTISLPARVEKS